MGLFGKKKVKLKTFSVVHLTGLNILENSNCDVVIENDKIIIKNSGQEFILKIENIRNIDFQMDIDEKQYLKSSLIKGVIGATTFGVTGAIIGSAPKTKTKREVKGYSIITYENIKNEYITIVLKDEFPNTLECAKMVDELKPKIKCHINKVEL